MEINFFKTLWGFSGDFYLALQEIEAAGFHGLEGPCPRDKSALDPLLEQFSARKLDYIAEICACGSYVPDRKATPDEHLADIKKKILQALPLRPRFFNIMAGCDAWPVDVKVDFFRRAVDIANELSVICSFETHRGRAFFNPWVTAEVAAQVPGLFLTLDVSHWVVVCERLLDTDWDVLEKLIPLVHHIHARVGYPQGPQVPHPAAPEYADCLRFHQQCWEKIWLAQTERGYAITTMTPEFGPDGYLHTLPFTNMPVGELWSINKWMAETEQRHYREFTAVNR